MRKFKIIANALIFISVIGIGIAATIAVKKINSKKSLAHDIENQAAKVVDVMKVTKQAFTATVVAYGNVEPAMVLQGKAELSGKISYIHPDLKEGGVFRKARWLFVLILMITRSHYNKLRLISLQHERN